MSSSNVYYRFFSLAKDSETLTKIRAHVDKINNKVALATAIGNEFGAKEAVFVDSFKVFGFKFDETPDTSLWKRTKHHNAWSPKLSTKAGKALAQRLKDLPDIGYMEDCLLDRGLKGGFSGAFQAGLTFYPVSVVGKGDGSDEWFVRMAWQDLDPEELDAYKADEQTHSLRMDYLLWTPHESWVEVKEWEVKKALESNK